MTPKEKAQELVEKFNKITQGTATLNGTVWLDDAKTCALIAVEEILKVIYYEGRSEYIYWQEVKQEIENL